jgi:hypothetical protein
MIMIIIIFSEINRNQFSLSMIIMGSGEVGQINGGVDGIFWISQLGLAGSELFPMRRQAALPALSLLRHISQTSL